MGCAVEVENLIKIYRKDTPPAVAGLSLTVPSGEVFGLLGPNGAGKTTTVGVLTTRVMPTSGRATVAGVDVVRSPRLAKQHLAVVPQRTNLDRSLSIRQNLLFHAAYHGIGRSERKRRADAMLRRLGLEEQADSRIDWLSGGQTQRVMIGRALMHSPAVLFLDEPTAGLDPQARLFLHDRIAELRAEGLTVVLTTHDMDEAEKLCDRVGIIDHGRLLALDTPAALMKSVIGRTTVTVTVSAAGPEHVAQVLSTVAGVERVEIVGARPAAAPAMAGGGMGGFPIPPGMAGMPFGAPGAHPAAPQLRLYVCEDSALVLPRVLAALADVPAELSEISFGSPSLEDVFIHLTGRELR